MDLLQVEPPFTPKLKKDAVMTNTDFAVTSLNVKEKLREREREREREGESRPLQKDEFITEASTTQLTVFLDINQDTHLK